MPIVNLARHPPFSFQFFLTIFCEKHKDYKRLVGILIGSVGILIFSVGILILSVGILIFDVGIMKLLRNCRDYDCRDFDCRDSDIDPFSEIKSTYFECKTYVIYIYIGQDSRVSKRGGAGYLWRLRHGRQNGTCKKVGKPINDPKNSMFSTHLGKTIISSKFADIQGVLRIKRILRTSMGQPILSIS